MDSPLCEACLPQAASVCGCAAPEQRRIRALLLLAHQIPAFYTAKAEFRHRRAPQQLPAIAVQLQGPRILPPCPSVTKRSVPPSVPPSGSQTVCVAEGGAWKLSRKGAPAQLVPPLQRSSGQFWLPAGAVLQTSTSSAPLPRARLDASFRRCDDERAALQASFYCDAEGRDQYGRPVDGRLMQVGAGHWVRVGSTFHLPAPKPPERPMEELVPMRVASALELRMHFPVKRTEARPALPGRLLLHGLNTATQCCSCCGRPKCFCRAPLMDWACRCGASQHFAVLCDGAEAWACTRCERLASDAPEEAQQILQGLRMEPPLHPIEHAAWALRVGVLPFADGSVRLLKRRPQAQTSSAQPMSGDLKLSGATEAQLRALPIHEIFNDPRARAMQLGSCFEGSLLQLAMAMKSFGNGAGPLDAVRDMKRTRFDAL